MLNMRNHVRVRRFLWKLRYLRITSVTGDQSRLISLWFWSVINRESIIWSLLRCWNASSSRSDRLVIWSNNSSSSRSDQFRVQFLGRILDRQGICVAALNIALIHAPLIPLPDTWGRPDADYHYPPPSLPVEDDDDHSSRRNSDCEVDNCACDLAAFFIQADVGGGRPMIWSPFF